MRKLIILGIVFFSLVATMAQENKPTGQSEKARPDVARPDFSGTWLRDNAKSSGLQGAVATAELTMVIAHNEPELKISRSLKLNDQPVTQELVYYTDRRGETNPATFGGTSLKSKTKWDKNKIETRASWSTETRGGEVNNFDSTEKWELGAEGKTLTYTIDIASPRGVRTIKQVFNRVS